MAITDPFDLSQVGANDQVLGVQHTATQLEYKSLTSNDHTVVITPTAGAIDFSCPGSGGGAVPMFSGMASAVASGAVTLTPTSPSFNLVDGGGTIALPAAASSNGVGFIFNHVGGTQSPATISVSSGDFIATNVGLGTDTSLSLEPGQAVALVAHAGRQTWYFAVKPQ